jgi:predicted alpha/beta hydrolase family esterase
MKMDYFLDDWCQDVVQEASAFGAFGACHLVACSLGVVELVHLKLSPKQLVMTKKVVLEYLMMLVIESQEANQPKLLQLFQL